MIPTIRDQISAMEKEWPGFRVVLDFGWLAIWEGEITPLQLPYRIRIIYCWGKTLSNAYIVPFGPKVTVIDPILSRREEVPDELIPHHYPNFARPDHPFLCLYDPQEDDWQFTDLIAEKILPWTIDWLTSYEGWQATGEWASGGRHPDIRSSEECAKSLHQNDQPTRLNDAAFNWIGQKTGTFASSVLMAVASEGSLRPLTYADWNNVTSAGALSRAISILSAERQPVVYSRSHSPAASRLRSFLTSMSSEATKSSHPSLKTGSEKSKAA